MPAHIPVLAEGENNIQIFAGIKNNGQSNNRIIYPFYTNYETDLTLVPGNTDTLYPEVLYKSKTVFSWLEDFEDRSISLEQSGTFSTIDSLFIIDDPTLVFQYSIPGSRYSAGGFMDTGYQHLEFSSTRLFDPPRGEFDVYLEFNFKSDIALTAGFYPINAQVVTGVPVVTFYPTTEWKKAYVSLARDISVPDYRNSDIRLFFAAIKNNTDTVANVYLDNIKLVHF